MILCCKVTNKNWIYPVSGPLFLRFPCQQLCQHPFSPHPCGLGSSLSKPPTCKKSTSIISQKRIGHLPKAHRSSPKSASVKLEPILSHTPQTSLYVLDNRYAFVWQLSFNLVAVVTQSCGSCGPIVWQLSHVMKTA